MAQHQQLVDIVAALPGRWREARRLAALGEDALLPHDDCFVSPDGLQLVLRAQHGWDVMDVRGDGSLIEPVVESVAAVPDGWRPACTLPVPLPKSRWSAEQLQDYEEAPHAERHLHRPMQPRLLGAWSEVQVYPGAWAVGADGDLPLHQYSSAAVCMDLTAQAAWEAVKDERMPDYEPGMALRPLLWEDPARPGVTGLAALEAQWCDLALANHRAAAQVLLDIQLPAEQRLWAAVSHGYVPGTGLMARHVQLDREAAAAAVGVGPSRLAPPPQPGPPAVAGAAAGAAAGHDDQGDGTDAAACAACWRRLWSCPATNGVKGFGVRLLHGGPPCGAMEQSLQEAPSRQASLCQHCQPPAATSAAAPLETYTHLFMQCPSSAPAITWLLDLWEWIAGAGHRPPCDPRVIIADELHLWPAAPDSVTMVQLWTALRLTVLHSIWCARHAPAGRQRGAAAAVARVVSSLRESMRDHFLRARAPQVLADRLPVRFLQRAQPVQRDDPMEVWLLSRLCSVAAGGCDIILTGQHPVLGPVEVAPAGLQ